MKPFTFRLVLATSLLTVALSLPVAPAQAQSGLKKVVMTQGTHAVSFLPIYVALHNGYWEEEGLDVEVIFTRGGSECLTAVLGGDALVCALASPTLIQAWSQGHTNLISVASLINRFTMNGVVRKDFLSRKGISDEEFKRMSVLDRMRAQKGAVMGITGPGAMTDVFTRWLVRSAGLDPDRDITIMPLGGGGALYTALTTGRIDGFVLSPPLSEQPVAEGTGVTFVNNLEGELEGFSDFVYEVLVTRKQAIHEETELLKAVVNGLRKANNFVADHANDAATLAAIAHEFFPELDMAVLELSTTGVASAVPRDALHTEDGWRAVLSFLEDGGMVERGVVDPAEGGFWTNEFTR